MNYLQEGDTLSQGGESAIRRPRLIITAIAVKALAQNMRMNGAIPLDTPQGEDIPVETTFASTIIN